MTDVWWHQKQLSNAIQFVGMQNRCAQINEEFLLQEEYCQREILLSAVDNHLNSVTNTSHASQSVEVHSHNC